MSTLTKDATKYGGLGKTEIGLHNAILKQQQELAAATSAGNKDKIKEIEQKIRDAQSAEVKAIGDQLLKGDAKNAFDASIELGKLARDRLALNKDLLPSFGDLITDPTTDPNALKRTTLQMLQGNFGQLGGIAAAMGFGKEFGALNAGMQIADLFDRYGLGGSSFSDLFGTPKQIKDLTDQIAKGDLGSLGLGQAGVGLANIQSGLDMLSALGGYFGFGKDIAKVKQAVSALQGLAKAFDGDIAGGIGGILALDGLLFKLPPEAKEALAKAKQLAEGLKKFAKMKAPAAKPAGVYVEGKHIAAVGLSGTVHGIMLAPGPGALTVLAYGSPVWRTITDKHICPLPGPGGAPHAPAPGAFAAAGATKTYAEDYWITRHEDSVMEPNGGGAVKIVPKAQAMAIALKRAQDEAKRKAAEKAKAAAKAAAAKAAAAQRQGGLGSGGDSALKNDPQMELPAADRVVPSKMDVFKDKMAQTGQDILDHAKEDVWKDMQHVSDDATKLLQDVGNAPNDPTAFMGITPSEAVDTLQLLKDETGIITDAVKDTVKGIFENDPATRDVAPYLDPIQHTAEIAKAVEDVTELRNPTKYLDEIEDTQKGLEEGKSSFDKLTGLYNAGVDLKEKPVELGEDAKKLQEQNSQSNEPQPQANPESVAKPEYDFVPSDGSTIDHSGRDEAPPGDTIEAPQ